MPDDLYERDIWGWAAQQADRLRRVAAGGSVDGVDWARVAEEIEGVGLSQLHDVRSFLRDLIVASLRVQAFPDSSLVPDWREEMISCQFDAEQRFAPSMRERLDLDHIYASALRQLGDVVRDGHGTSMSLLPASCPFTPEQLLNGDPAGLEATLRDASSVNEA
jgi:Domain of unknown function DUF29